MRYDLEHEQANSMQVVAYVSAPEEENDDYINEIMQDIQSYQDEVNGMTADDATTLLLEKIEAEQQ